MPISSTATTANYHFSIVAIMEKARNSTDKINNAALEAQANSVQGINSEVVNVEQAGATYMECGRNGGYTIDGCGKFFKGAGQDETKEALLCATCRCHRSFHRKVLSPPHLRNSKYYIMNYLCARPLTVLQPRPPTPWLMRSLTLPSYELIEGQGSSISPSEAEEKSESDSGRKLISPQKITRQDKRRQ